MVAKVIVVANQKGGVGKTTMCLNIGAGLKNKGYRVELIDADKQGSLKDWVELGGNLPISVLTNSKSFNTTLPVRCDASDWIIVDAPPDREHLVLFATIAAADLVLIPTKSSYFDVKATEAIEQIISMLEAASKSLPQTYFLPNMVPVSSSMGDDLVELLRGDDFKFNALNSLICNRIAFARTASDGGSIYDGQDKKAIAEIDALVNEILEKFNVNTEES